MKNLNKYKFILKTTSWILLVMFSYNQLLFAADAQTLLDEAKSFFLEEDLKKAAGMSPSDLQSSQDSQQAVIDQMQALQDLSGSATTSTSTTNTEASSTIAPSTSFSLTTDTGDILKYVDNKLSSVKRPDGTELGNIVQDVDGNIQSSFLRLNDGSIQIFDQGKILGYTTPDGTQVVYNLDGSIQKTISKDNTQTLYSKDASGNTILDSPTHKVTYDANGKIKESKRLSDNQITTYQDGIITKISNSNGVEINFIKSTLADGSTKLIPQSQYRDSQANTFYYSPDGTTITKVSLADGSVLDNIVWDAANTLINNATLTQTDGQVFTYVNKLITKSTGADGVLTTYSMAGTSTVAMRLGVKTEYDGNLQPYRRTDVLGNVTLYGTTGTFANFKYKEQLASGITYYYDYSGSVTNPTVTRRQELSSLYNQRIFEGQSYISQSLNPSFKFTFMIPSDTSLDQNIKLSAKSVDGLKDLSVNLIPGSGSSYTFNGITTVIPGLTISKATTYKVELAWEVSGRLALYVYKSSVAKPTTPQAIILDRSWDPKLNVTSNNSTLVYDATSTAGTFSFDSNLQEKSNLTLTNNPAFVNTVRLAAKSNNSINLKLDDLNEGTGFTKSITLNYDSNLSLWTFTESTKNLADNSIIQNVSTLSQILNVGTDYIVDARIDAGKINLYVYSNGSTRPTSPTKSFVTLSTQSKAQLKVTQGTFQSTSFRNNLQTQTYDANIYKVNILTAGKSTLLKTPTLPIYKDLAGNKFYLSQDRSQVTKIITPDNSTITNMTWDATTGQLLNADLKQSDNQRFIYQNKNLTQSYDTANVLTSYAYAADGTLRSLKNGLNAEYNSLFQPTKSTDSLSTVSYYSTSGTYAGLKFKDQTSSGIVSYYEYTGSAANPTIKKREEAYNQNTLTTPYTSNLLTNNPLLVSDFKITTANSQSLNITLDNLNEGTGFTKSINLIYDSILKKWTFTENLLNISTNTTTTTTSTLLQTLNPGTTYSFEIRQEAGKISLFVYTKGATKPAAATKSFVTLSTQSKFSITLNQSTLSNVSLRQNLSNPTYSKENFFIPSLTKRAPQLSNPLIQKPALSNNSNITDNQYVIYDSNQKLKEVKTKDNNTLYFTDGILNKILDPTGKETTLDVTQSDLLNISGSVITQNNVKSSYNASGDLESVELPNNLKIHYKTDKSIDYVEQPDGAEIHNIVFDESGNIQDALFITADGEERTYLGGKLKEIKKPDQTKLFFDTLTSKVQSMITADKLNYNFTYKPDGDIEAVIQDPTENLDTQATIRMQYDSNFNLKKIVKKNNEVIEYLNNQIQSILPENSSATPQVFNYTYDANGKVLSYTITQGNVVTYYDANNNPTSAHISADAQNPNTFDITYQYGKIRQVKKNDALLYEYSYTANENNQEQTNIKDLSDNSLKTYQAKKLITNLDTITNVLSSYIYLSDTDKVSAVVVTRFGKQIASYNYSYSGEQTIVTDAEGVIRTYGVNNKLLYLEKPSEKFAYTYTMQEIKDPITSQVLSREEIVSENLIQKTTQDGSIIHYVNGKVAQVDNVNGSILKNIISATDGQIQQATYFKNVSDVNGVLVEFEDGLISRTTTSSGDIVTFSYEKNDDTKIVATLAKKGYITFKYNASGNLIGLQSDRISPPSEVQSTATKNFIGGGIGAQSIDNNFETAQLGDERIGYLGASGSYAMSEQLFATPQNITDIQFRASAKATIQAASGRTYVTYEARYAIHYLVDDVWRELQESIWRCDGVNTGTCSKDSGIVTLNNLNLENVNGIRAEALGSAYIGSSIPGVTEGPASSLAGIYELQYTLRDQSYFDVEFGANYLGNERLILKGYKGQVEFDESGILTAPNENYTFLRQDLEGQIQNYVTSPLSNSEFAKARAALSDKETVISQEYSASGDLEVQSKLDGSVTLFENSKPSKVLNAQGAVLIKYSYDAQGRSSKIYLEQARENLAAEIKKSKELIEQKRAETLRNLSSQRNLAYQSIQNAYQEERNTLELYIPQYQNQYNEVANTDVKGKKAKSQRGDILNQITEQIVSVRAAIAESFKNEANAYSNLDAQVKTLSDSIELDSQQAFTALASQELELKHSILKQEVSPIIYDYYRRILGRDPDSAEYDLWIKKVDYDLTAVADEVRVLGDISLGFSLNQFLNASPELIERQVYVQNIKNNVTAQVNNYLTMSSAAKNVFISSLGLTNEDLVPLSEVDAQKILQWLNARSLHFGQSAFLSLESLLDQKGISYAREDIAKKAILIDILSGIISPLDDGDLVISMFALNKVARGYGLELSGANVSWKDLQAIYQIDQTAKVVAHISGNHYVIITNISDENVTYIDPGIGKDKHNETITVQKDGFLKVWQGNITIETALIQNTQKIQSWDYLKQLHNSGKPIIGPQTAAVAIPGSSIKFNGSAYLSVANNGDFNFGRGDYTIEFAINFSEVKPRGMQRIFGTTGTYDFYLELAPDGPSLALGLYVGGHDCCADKVKSVAWIPTAGQWYYVAITRSGTSLDFWIDGKKIGSTTQDFSNVNYSTNLEIGGHTTTGIFLNGRMDDIRISKGIARYATDFSPDLISYQPDSYTVLMLNGGGVNGTTTFTDISRDPKFIVTHGAATSDATTFYKPLQKEVTHTAIIKYPSSVLDPLSLTPAQVQDMTLNPDNYGERIITHINGGHEITVTSVSDDSITYLDGATTVMRTKADFLQIWDADVTATHPNLQLSNPEQPSTIKLLTADQTKAIRGAFWGSLLGLIGSVFVWIPFLNPLGLALTAISAIVSGIEGDWISAISSIITLGIAPNGLGGFFKDAFSSVTTSLGALGNVFNAVGGFIANVYKGVVGFAGSISEGIGHFLSGALGVSSKIATNIATTAVSVGLSYGVSSGLTALGVNPQIAGFAGSLAAGGIVGGFKPETMAGGHVAISHAQNIKAGIQSAITLTQVGRLGQELELDPAFTNIIGLSLSAMQGHLITNPGSNIEFAFNEIKPNIASSLSQYGISKIGNSLGVDSSIANLIGSPLSGAIGASFQNGVDTGKGVVSAINLGLQSGFANILVDYAGEALHLNPLLNGVSASLVAGAISGLFGINQIDPADPNHVIKPANMFEGISNAFLRGLSSTLTLGGVGDDAWRQAAYVQRVSSFSTIVREMGLSKAIDTYASSMFQQSAIDQMIIISGSVKQYIDDQLASGNYVEKTEDGELYKYVFLPGSESRDPYSTDLESSYVKVSTETGKEDVYGIGEYGSAVDGQYDVMSNNGLGLSYDGGSVATIYEGSKYFQKWYAGDVQYTNIVAQNGNIGTFYNDNSLASITIADKNQLFDGKYIDASGSNVIIRDSKIISYEKAITENGLTNLASDFLSAASLSATLMSDVQTSTFEGAFGMLSDTNYKNSPSFILANLANFVGDNAKQYLKTSYDIKDADFGRYATLFGGVGDKVADLYSGYLNIREEIDDAILDGFLDAAYIGTEIKPIWDELGQAINALKVGDINKAAKLWGGVETRLFREGNRVLTLATLGLSAAGKEALVQTSEQVSTRILSPLGEQKLLTMFPKRDWFYGPSAGRQLEETSRKFGGTLLADAYPRLPSGFDDFHQLTKYVLDDAVVSNRIVHFDLTNMNNLEGVLGGTAFRDNVTTTEIRYIIGNWDKFKSTVKFYKAEGGILKEFTDIAKLRKLYKRG